jgi:hypothetical protein
MRRGWEQAVGVTAVLQLIHPTASLYEAWMEAHLEWGPGLHEDGFGLTATDDVDTVDGFTRWVDQLHATEDLCASR